MTKRAPSLGVIFFTVFIDLIGFGITLPLSPYYAEHFGASAFHVGLLQASYSLMQFIFAPLWGNLSDRIGRRPVLLISVAGSCISYFTFANASALWMLFASRMFQGMCTANFGAAQAYIADITPPENRSKNMGLIGAAFGMGFIFGPAIGAFLSHIGPDVASFVGTHPEGMFGMGFPALGASLLCFLNFIFVLIYLPESLDKNNMKVNPIKRGPAHTLHEIADKLKRPELGWLMVIFFLSTFALANMESTLALFMEVRLKFGVRQTGNLFAFTGLFMAFTQGYLIRKLLPKYGEKKLLIYGPMLLSLGYFILPFTVSFYIAAASMIFIAIGSGLSNPAVMGAISQVARSDEQGTVLGVAQSCGSLGRILGPACGGFIFSGLGAPAPFFVAGLTIVAVIIIISKHVHRLPQKIQAQPLSHLGT